MKTKTKTKKVKASDFAEFMFGDLPTDKRDERIAGWISTGAAVVETDLDKVRRLRADWRTLTPRPMPVDYEDWDNLYAAIGLGDLLDGKQSACRDADDIVRALKKDKYAVAAAVKPARLTIHFYGDSAAAVLDGDTFPLRSIAHAEYLQCLLDKKGASYAPPKNSNIRPDRLRCSLPKEIQQIIQSAKGPGGGSWLTIFKSPAPFGG
jgi:hypothetical protein